MRDPRRRPIRRVAPPTSSVVKPPLTSSPSFAEKTKGSVSRSIPRPNKTKKSGINGATVVLIIISLALLGTSLFLYKKRLDIEEKLTSEKEVLLRDFEEIKQKFEIISIRNTELNDSLSESTAQVSQYIDSLKTSRFNARKLRAYRSKYLALYKDNKIVLRLKDSLIKMVGDLTEERNSLVFQLKEQINVNDSLVKANKTLKEYVEQQGKDYLPQKSNETNTGIEEPSLVVDNFSIVGQSTSKGGKSKEEKKVKKSSKIKVCFTILPGSQVESGQQSLYLKVVGPKGDVLGKKQTITLKGKKKVYSLKSSFFYDKDNGVDVCEFLSKGKKSFKSGNYSIAVYDSNAVSVGRYETKLK